MVNGDKSRGLQPAPIKAAQGYADERSVATVAS
jgi:hypothetical protein